MLAAVDPASHSLTQTAFQILVASSAQILARDEGDVWDSGRQMNPVYTGISFAGAELQSHTRYFWKVRVWDQDGKPSAWSAPTFWITGLLHAADWKTTWIAAEADGPLAPQAREHEGAMTERAAALPIFRYDFAIAKPVRQAIVYVSGLGQYELRLNGASVTTSVLNPGWTQYRKAVLYNTRDVTALLHAGRNAFGVLLGNGMYNVPGVRGRYTKFIGSFGQPKMILQMVVQYADGTQATIVSNREWRTISGPVVFSSIYGGEDYDARKEPAGWDRPGFDDQGWTNALEVRGPDGEADPGGELRAQRTPPIEVARRFDPVRITHPRAGVTVYDLGQNFAGWPVIAVRGHAGDRIRMLPGELLDGNGLVTQASGGGGPDDATLFTYTLSGHGVERWHPAFAYYGFRYVQVEATGAERARPPVIVRLEGDFLHAAAAQDGTFATSERLLSRIHGLIDMAILSNMMSVLTDCPTREKLGWLEQTHLAATSVMMNYDVVQLYEKMAGDMADSQLPDGLVPAIAPEYVAFVDRNGVSTDFRDSPEWGSAIVLSPWAAYQTYGDRRVLSDHYAQMQRYVDYLATKARDGIISYGLGDWFDIGPGDPGESQLTSKGITATAIYYQDLTTLVSIAQVLGRDEDSHEYLSKAQEVRTAFNGRYFHPETNQYDRDSQTADAMPLALGMVSEDRREAVLANLVADIREHNNHVTAGDVGFHYVVRALTDGDRSDVLLDMLLRTDAPSYGSQLARGATTLTEAWDGNPAESQDHLMLGHAEEWFYRGLAGIDIDLVRPSGQQIRIAPAILDGVPGVSAKYDSVLGPISVRWEHGGSSVSISVEIPAGARAMLQLPVRAGRSLMEDGKVIAGGGTYKVELGSGVYRYTER